MKAVKTILVEVDSTYNNEVEVGGISILVNTTIESVAHINRMARVISAPENTLLEAGDKIIVHHNIFRKKNSTTGEEVESDFYVEKGIYYVPPTEVFAYKRDGVWTALDPFVFIAPVEKQKNDSEIIEIVNHDKFVPNIGTIEFINEELTDWGLTKGDTIYFSDHSEYEFDVEGRLLYRMKTSDILGRYE